MVQRVSLRDPVKEELKRQKKEEEAKNLWLQSSPDVARSYANDPRTQVANSLTETGINTAPLQGGITEGIARLGSGLLGGYIGKQQQNKYAGNQAGLDKAVQGALAPTLPGLSGQSVAAGDATSQAAVANVAGGGNALQAGPGGSVIPTAPPPGSIANVAAALTPGAASPVAPNFPQAPVVSRGMAQGGGVVGGQATMPLTSTAIQTQSRTPPTGVDGRTTTNSGSVILPANDAFGSVISGGNTPRLRGARDTVIQDSGGLGANLMSGGPSVTTIGPRVAARQAAAAGVSGTPEAEAKGWLAPRAQREAARASGKFGAQDDPYGSYGAVYGYGTYGRPPKPLPEMTIGEVLDFGDSVLRPATKSAGIGRAADGSIVGTSAGGAFQIVGDTLRRIALKELGADYRTKGYTVENQDQLGKALFDESKKGNLKAIWTSLPDPTPGAYANMSWKDMKPLIIAGESNVKGGNSASGGVGAGSSGVDANGVPIAPQMDVTPLPAAPVEPPRPAPRDPITSARLEAIQRLMPGISGLGPGSLGAAAHMLDDIGGKGFDAVQDARMQQDRQEAALTQSAYDTNLGIYGEGNKDLFKQRVGQTTADQAFNRSTRSDQYQGDVNYVENRRKAQEDAEAARLLAERQEQAQKAHDERVANNLKMSNKDKEEYRRKSTTIRQIERAIEQIKDPRNAGAFNVIEGNLPDSFKGGLRPEAVRARAFLADLMGSVRHQRAGTAVTANEAGYLKPYLASDADWNNGQAISKLESMKEMLGMDLQGIQTQYGANNPYIAGFSNVFQQGTQSPGWGQAKER